MEQESEAWAIGKFQSNEKINKDAKCRVSRSLWYTKENVNFVKLTDGILLVKINLIEDKERILNMAPWFFYQNLFSMVPFVENKDFCEYNFGMVPFWICICNFPREKMDRQLA